MRTVSASLEDWTAAAGLVANEECRLPLTVEGDVSSY
jgi:hypothetical protein